MASPEVNLFDIDNERKSRRKSPVESLLGHGDYSASSPESDCGMSRR